MTVPILGIDLGTTYTVAALTGTDGRTQPLLFDASFLLPSAVYADSDTRLLVGRDAERSARLDPVRFEPNPKRRVDEGSVLLGHREYPVAELLAAVLRRVADEAARVAGALPGSVVLTHPASWAGGRRAVLTDAAERAGLPAVVLVPEPVAAAYYFTTVMGCAVPAGGNLLIYDFGGGTFDTTVLRRGTPDGWQVLVSDGAYDLGGVDLDAAIVEHLGRTLAVRDAALWQRLRKPTDDGARRRMQVLQEEARAAKEQLSRSSSAAIPVPLFDTDVVLTREEFEQLARPYLQRTVDLTATAIQRAGLRPDQLNGLFLVGGSSRVPLVSTLLFQRLGIAPTLIEQPELVVALGSVLAVSPAPVAGTAGAPVSGLPISGPPVPVSPVPGADPVTAGFRAPGLPPTAPAAAMYEEPPYPAPLPVPVPTRSRGRASLALLAVLVLLACSAGGVAVWRLTNGGHTTGNTGTGGNRGAATGPANIAAGQPGLTGQAGGSHQSAAVNRTVWYTGLKLTFGAVQYDGTKSYNQLSAAVLVENIGSATESANLPITFTNGDVQGEAKTQQADVQAGTKVALTYAFDAANMKTSLADGVFLVGRSDEAVAVVPVSAKNIDKFRDLQPRRVLTTVGVTFRDLKVSYNFCDVRGGYPWDLGEAKKDHLILYCEVDVQYTGGNLGGIYVGGDMFHLALPDGTEVAPVRMWAYDVNSGQKISNVEIPFEIKAPVAGSYQLRIIDVPLGVKRSPDLVHDTPLVIP